MAETFDTLSVDTGLPSGVVTFLLTDVAGSTVLWEQAPEGMSTALARHDAIFEDLVREHGGIPIRPRGEGDSRFAVFDQAQDAVYAALEIQRAYAAQDWPTPSRSPSVSGCTPARPSFGRATTTARW